MKRTTNSTNSRDMEMIDILKKIRTDKSGDYIQITDECQECDRCKKAFIEICKECGYEPDEADIQLETTESVKSCARTYLDEWIFVNICSMIREALPKVDYLTKGYPSLSKLFPAKKYAQKIDFINAAIDCFDWANEINREKFPSINTIYSWYESFPNNVPEKWADRMYTEL